MEHEPTCEAQRTYQGRCTCGLIDFMRPDLRTKDRQLLGGAVANLLLVEGVQRVILTTSVVTVQYRNVALPATAESGEGLGIVAWQVLNILLGRRPWPEGWGPRPME